MDYVTLRTNVQDAMGRSDVPTYIYDLANSEINRKLVTRARETTTTLSASTELTALPSDFWQMVSVYLNSGGIRYSLTAHSADAINENRGDSGVPWGYAIVNGSIKLIPTPDGTYTLNLRYITELSALSADGDTNVVMTAYPDVYIYGALKHAATWAKDAELALGYASAFDDSLNSVRESETMTLGPIARRAEPPLC